MDLKEKWKQFTTNMNENGVPLPMVRENGKASMSATLVFLSFNVWLISINAKLASTLGGVDSNATLQMFIVCAGLYFGRKFQATSDGKVTVDEDKKRSKK